MRLLFLFSLLASPFSAVSAQRWLNADTAKRINQSTFRALEEWPTPNERRTAAGSPGLKYWQQRVDYVIRASLDTSTHRISGSERVTYHNNSPDELRYLWFQLDQNIEDSSTSRAIMSEQALPPDVSRAAAEFLVPERFEGGNRLTRVQVAVPGASKGRTRLVDAAYVVNGTLLKVPLPAPLKAGGRVDVEIDWSFVLPQASRHNGRGVREKVKDGWMYEVAQWFPRASVYDDVNGWQTDQFMGQGEFYLNFGNYDVALTVPHDHIVEATGVLQNPDAVLTATQRRRLAEAWQSETPVFVIRADEVGTPASRPAGAAPLTWRFVATNVRDFAWVSSRAYVWDAAGYRYKESVTPIQMHSLYPREAMPLWDKVSTKSIAQTMRTYGRMAFEYPYPKAVNVHGPVWGMEYPMMAFCGARPDAEGKYTPELERALVSVTIHEVGHNWYPMIVASDERKWTWMDEGINSFLQYYAEQEWEKGYPSRRGPAPKIVNYMKQGDQAPIMTESDAIHRSFGDNGYGKPAAGLVMLREQVVGPELFDQAFQEYSNKWQFKHPQPADFFRTLDEGSGDKLSWFWRGWFYTTFANDQALAGVQVLPADSLFGNTNRGKSYVKISVENKGGLVMPIHARVTFADGTNETIKLPAEAWQMDEKAHSFGMFTNKVVTKVVLDPDEVFADIDRGNNVWSAAGGGVS
jgi:hypothetical protein